MTTTLGRLCDGLRRASRVAALVVGAGLMLLVPPASQTCGVVEAFRATLFPHDPCTLEREQSKSETGGWFDTDADDDGYDDPHNHSIIQLTSFFDRRGERDGNAPFDFQFDAPAVDSGGHSLRAPPR
jgi:hypothetical protein